MTTDPVSVHIEVIGDQRPDDERLARSLMDEISFHSRPLEIRTQSYVRVGEVEKVEMTFTPKPYIVDEKAGTIAFTKPIAWGTPIILDDPNPTPRPDHYQAPVPKLQAEIEELRAFNKQLIARNVEVSAEVEVLKDDMRRICADRDRYQVEKEDALALLKKTQAQRDSAEAHALKFATDREAAEVKILRLEADFLEMEKRYAGKTTRRQFYTDEAPLDTLLQIYERSMARQPGEYSVEPGDLVSKEAAKDLARLGLVCSGPAGVLITENGKALIKVLKLCRVDTQK